jgi:hypothetical protein
MRLFSPNKPPFFSVFAEQTETQLVCSWVCPNNVKALFRFARLCSEVKTNYPEGGLPALPLLFIAGQRYKASQQSGQSNDPPESLNQESIRTGKGKSNRKFLESGKERTETFFEG